MYSYRGKLTLSHLKVLLKRFWPLFLTDFTMTLGDSIRTLSLNYLPSSITCLAIFGILKSWTTLFESPIISILQASTDLSRSQQSRLSLRLFTIILAIAVTCAFSFFCLGPWFEWILIRFYHIEIDWFRSTQYAFYSMLLWPLIIAWRRFNQGALIFMGLEKHVAIGSFLRLIAGAFIGLGFVYFYPSGLSMVVTSLMLSAFLEALYVQIALNKNKNLLPRAQKMYLESSGRLPQNLKQVFDYYSPLAQNMIFFWILRTLLVFLIASSSNGNFMLAVWTSVWSIALPLTNGSRMVQQIALSEEKQDTDLFFIFSILIGIGLGLPLFFFSFIPQSEGLMLTYLNNDLALKQETVFCLKFLTLFPLFTAIQSLTQGLCLKKAKNKTIKKAGLTNALLSLILSLISIQYFGFSGALSATVALNIGIIIEILILLRSYFT